MDTHEDDITSLLAMLHPQESHSQADIYKMLSPDDKKLYSEPFADEQESLKNRQAMAEALRASPMEHHTTGVGAAFEGLGHMVDSGMGAYQSSKISKEQQALIERKGQAHQSGMSAYERAMAENAKSAPLHPQDEHPETFGSGDTDSLRDEQRRPDLFNRKQLAGEDEQNLSKLFG